jgi:hypothetical protein
MGRRIGRLNDAELGPCRIRRVNCAILGGELQGSTMPNLQVQWGRIGGYNGAILGQWRLRSVRRNSARVGGELGGETTENWEVQLFRIGRRIGRFNNVELAHAMGQNWEFQGNWQANWEVQQCKIGRRIGR